MTVTAMNPPARAVQVNFADRSVPVPIIVSPTDDCIDLVTFDGERIAVVYGVPGERWDPPAGGGRILARVRTPAGAGVVTAAMIEEVAA